MNTKISEYLIERKQTSSFDCSICNGDCCQGSGFAIFENTLLIYEIYIRGKLVRDDYTFEQELSYKDFIQKYFDVVVYNNSQAIFYPRQLNKDNRLIVIPPFGSYYSNRDYILEYDKTIINTGCIFQNKKRTNSTKNIMCILHNQSFMTKITEKPIDCIFLNCSKKKMIIKPTSEESSYWFSLLNYCYPESLKRYNERCN